MNIENKPVKVLQILNSLNCGGEETFVINLFNCIDLNKIEFVFLIGVVNNEIQFYENEIKLKKQKIYKIPSKSQSPIKNFYEIYKLVKHENIKIIHRHSDNSLMLLDLIASKLGGAKYLIAHSHSSGGISPKYKWLHEIFKVLLGQFTNKNFACSEQAGKWMFGRKKFVVIPNAINIERFVFNLKLREKMRSQLGIQNECIIGHVGRFDKLKNQQFVLEVFKEMLKINHSLVLILIGKGETQKEIRNLVLKYGLSDKVLFPGECDNVYEYMQAMDIFLFPSIVEGLGIAGIEAQAAGLTCYFSSNRVPKEIGITKLANFLPLERGASYWAEKILENEKWKSRKNMKCLIQKRGYDMKCVAEYFEKLYQFI